MTRSLTSREIVALTVLGLLLEGPSHTYNLNREIRTRKMAFVTGLPRSVYHAVDRLAADGLVRLVETSRDGRRPERSVYEITEDGTRRFYEELTDLLMTPTEDRLPFTIALSFAVRMTPETVARLLATRASRLRAELAEVETMLDLGKTHVHRLALLEWEYTQKLRQAELDWVDRLGAEIASSRLGWDPEAILRDPSILSV
ncbi:helix-turn-helix transcriptional regulator [Amycolatopsis sp. A133]|uniref:helix-turn-helix transcriptional regulator n=1 Tax=Amycolatopsis sp. A133 TaxID=3064472 RepID=UPI0027FB4C78|nr:helix-turn-helix transcriptional regulator [Amycolatopsis sp. A133]MDQ7803521.1 helix-turn-helix transcriptional regulator [Amycolatopsis sp. A133]